MKVPVDFQEPLSKAVREKLRDEDRKRRRNYMPLAGIAVAPIVMGAAWLKTGDARFVDNVGTWIFCASLGALLIFFIVFERHSKQLTAVRQELSVDVRGVAGPVRQRYETRYDYDSFTVGHLHAYRKMRSWGSAALVAFSVAMGYAWTLFFGPYFWR